MAPYLNEFGDSQSKKRRVQRYISATNKSPLFTQFTHPIHTHTYAYTYTHAYTHTYTYTYTYTYT